jgi:hypothetical protein
MHPERKTYNLNVIYLLIIVPPKDQKEVDQRKKNEKASEIQNMD